MDTMTVQYTEWFDDNYCYVWVDIDTGVMYEDLEDAIEYAEENNLHLLIIIDNGY